MKKIISALAAISLIACSEAAVQPDNTTTHSDAATFDKAAMDQLLSKAVSSKDVIGVSALIFDDGETVYKEAFGLRDRENNLPVELNTIWRIYSMTKPITSVIIMDLEEEGKLSLQDPVSRYIPEFANMQVAEIGTDGKPTLTPQARPITVEDLLLHRAGLGYGIFGDMNPVETLYAKAGLLDPTETLDVKMKKLTQLPLVGQPGAAWYYSYSIDVLGRIAEIVTGQSFGEVLEERIFNPLGMSETGFYVKPDQKSRFAKNYVLKKNGTFEAIRDDNPLLNTNAFLEKPAFESGGGGLVSTMDDYAKFAQMMLDGGIYKGHRILEEATVQNMMTDHMGAGATFLFPWLGGETNNSFGYGGSIVIKETPEQIARNGQGLGHWGWSGAARTTFWIDRKNGSFGILMLQFFSENHPKIFEDVRALAYDQTKDQE